MILLPFYETDPPLYHKTNHHRDKTSRKWSRVIKRYYTCESMYP